MKLISVPLVFILAASGLYAQTQGVSSLDGITPEGLRPGSPAGSYALSGLDTINLYNGSANIRIPLLQIGGRGEAGYTMFAKQETHWDASGYYDAYTCT